MAADITDHYKVEITFVLKEFNQYNSQIDSGVVNITKKVKVKNLAQLGYLFAQIEQAVDNTNEHSR